MLFIDTDNAMGSRFGDIDDAFALTALILSKSRIAAIASVGGNCGVDAAERNNQSLGKILGYQGPFVAGAIPTGKGLSPASEFLIQCKTGLRVLALGPLTNIARAISTDGSIVSKLAEVIIVGTHFKTRGRWPPFWPKEFNLTKDRASSKIVFDSSLPLTIVPLDIAKAFTVTKQDLRGIRGEWGEYLRKHSSRWFLRNRILKWTGRIVLWDLVSALYAIDDDGFECEMVSTKFHKNAFVEYHGGYRKCLVIKGFDRNILWQRFLSLMDH